MRPHRGTAADYNSAGAHKRHSDGADGARLENGMHLCCEYRIMAPEEPAGDPATARGFTEIGYLPESRVKFKSFR